MSVLQKVAATFAMAATVPFGVVALHIEPRSCAVEGSSAPRQRHRLVLAHGFTQNARCWEPFGTELAALSDADLIAVDAPGHGQSGHDDADLWTAADLLVEAGGAATYVGYSMGGRVALHAALASPGSVKALVLIGATAGLDSEQERLARRRADADLADRLLTDGLDAFLDRWLANPLFAGLSEEAAALAQRRTNRAEGLAASLRNCGTGNQEPLWDRLTAIECPVLLIAGFEDQKFRRLADRFASALPAERCEVLVPPGAHAVHLVSPSETAAGIADFLSRRLPVEP